MKTNGNYFVALTRRLFFTLERSQLPRPVWRHQIADGRDFPRRPARRESSLSVWPNPKYRSTD